MDITAAMVKELREKTGAGMMDCKRALIETEGNIDKAIEVLREKGLAAVAKRAGKIVAEGLIDAYIHRGRIGVLVEVNSETDFVAKNQEFKDFVRDIALQIAASNPRTGGGRGYRKRKRNTKKTGFKRGKTRKNSGKNGRRENR